MNQNPEILLRTLQLIIIGSMVTCACSSERAKLQDFKTPYPLHAPGKTAAEQSYLEQNPQVLDIATNTIEPTKKITTITPTSQSIPTNVPKIYKTSTPEESLTPGHDLYFIGDGILKIWQRENGEITPLTYHRGSEMLSPITGGGIDSTAHVSEYVIDNKNNIIYLQLSKGIAANGVELYDLGAVHLDDDMLTTLITNTSKLYNLSLSPDASWLAYNMGERSILAIYTSGSRGNYLIGSCVVENETTCEGVVWSPGSDLALWSDDRGVWLSSLPDFLPKKIFGTQIEITSLHGEKETWDVRFSNLRWSPQGRYVLATVHPYRSEVSWQALMDTTRRKVVEIPGTYKYNSPAAEVKWLADGRLLMVQPNQSESKYQIQLDFFGVFPTSDSLLLKDKSLTVDISSIKKSISDQGDYLNSFNLKAYLVNERTILVFLKSNQRKTPAFILDVDMKYGVATEICDLPPGTKDIVLAPDGNHLILVDKPHEIYYLDYNTQIVHNISSRIDIDSCCFTWNTQ